MRERGRNAPFGTMFGHRQINTEMIRTSSKMALKLSCYEATCGDINDAERLYKYLSDGLAGLPDCDPAPVGRVQRIKDAADDIIGWAEGHADMINKGISILQMMKAKGAPTTELPPIPKI